MKTTMRYYLLNGQSVLNWQSAGEDVKLLEISVSVGMQMKKLLWKAVWLFKVSSFVKNRQILMAKTRNLNILYWWSNTTHSWRAAQTETSMTSTRIFNKDSKAIHWRKAQSLQETVLGQPHTGNEVGHPLSNFICKINQGAPWWSVQ